MKAIVCVKQVPDTSGKVAVKPDGNVTVTVHSETGSLSVM